MNSTRLKKVFHVIGVAGVLMTSGCATAFVRSKSTVDPEHAFPATAFDAQCFWNAGVKGEPLFATVDPTQKNNPVARVAYAVGGVIDLPFSILFDTILLPVDLSRPRKEDKDATREPDSAMR